MTSPVKQTKDTLTNRKQHETKAKPSEQNLQFKQQAEEIKAKIQQVREAAKELFLALTKEQHPHNSIVAAAFSLVSGVKMPQIEHTQNILEFQVETLLMVLDVVETRNPDHPKANRAKITSAVKKIVELQQEIEAIFTPDFTAKVSKEFYMREADMKLTPKKLTEIITITEAEKVMNNLSAEQQRKQHERVNKENMERAYYTLIRQTLEKMNVNSENKEEQEMKVLKVIENIEKNIKLSIKANIKQEPKNHMEHLMERVEYIKVLLQEDTLDDMETAFLAALLDNAMQIIDAQPRNNTATTKSHIKKREMRGKRKQRKKNAKRK
jgi:hypothetical protein